MALLKSPTGRKIGLGVGGAVIVLGLLWTWIAAKERNARDLAVADERDKNAKVLEQQLKANEEQRRIEREQTAKLIEANAELQANLARSMAARNESAQRTIVELRQPKTTEQVVKDSQEHLGITPTVVDNSIRLTPEQFQELIAIKVDRDRLAANVGDIEKQLRIEKDTVSRLNTQLAGFESTLKESNQLIADQRAVIESYKRVAKKGFWRKTGDITGKVGLAFGAAFIAAKVAN
jgi:chromosome segregation ATPase